ncbi:hypothetical protein [Romboutsia sp. 1001713B170207_170306_H8]|uniref:hypothetical protein n=1 Tax=Romboutsia sp. 1001713B170207_170306_H8 TaxID=2787112 RepID=UPI000820F71A|nr:hypothetical protein [Romboutsia sp. 1001713B170207_170306_H8]SCH43453.1 Uncharacterised protein [uncultured Clostridium sp.]
MLNNMINIYDIREDLINFINIVKDFKNEYKFTDYADLNSIEYEVEFDNEYSDHKESKIEDTWLDEMEIFSEKLNEIETENLIIISKIISLGKDLIKGKSEKEKVIIIQNEYLSNLYEDEDDYYESREEIIEDLFSKKGELLIRYIELGAKKLNII